MLANICLFLGLTQGVLIALDAILSADTKNSILNTVTALWCYLDDLRKVSFLSTLKKPLSKFFGVAIVTMINISIFAIAVLTSKHRNDAFSKLSIAELRSVNAMMIISAVVVSSLCGLVAFFALRKIAQALETRTIIKVVVGSLIFILLTSVITYGVNRVIADVVINDKSVKIYLGVLVIIFMLFLQIGENIAFIVVVPLLAINIATLVIFIVEALMRKIAENNKGPLIGIASTLTGIGSYLKLFHG